MRGGHVSSRSARLEAAWRPSNARASSLYPRAQFGGGGWEWSVHTSAWAAEWERNTQWPFLYMAEELNATGIWPSPRSPWPSWGDGGATVRTNVTRDTHWNEPTSAVLAPGQTVSYGLKISACAAGPREHCRPT